MSLAFTSWSFDQTSYTPGEAISLTVAYTSTDVVPTSDVVNAVNVALADAAGTASQSSDTSGNFPSFTTAVAGTSPEDVTVSASDDRSPSGTWTLVSNSTTSTEAPFAFTAVLSSVA